MLAEQSQADYVGNPQLEDGHSRIANELLEAMILFDFSKRHYKIILHVIRKTYGWGKKSDMISLSQIADSTGISRGHVCDSLNELVEMGVLLKREHQRGQVIEINKKYNDWMVLPKREHVTETVTKVLPKREQSVTETGTTKETNKIKERKSMSFLPENFSISDRVKTWAMKNGHSNLESHLEYFILQCQKKGYKYVDWDAAFMTAIRNNWAAVKHERKQVSV